MIRRLLCVTAFVMVGCGSDTPDPTGYVDAVWDGSQLTVDALYEINEEHSVTEILVDRAEATFRGQTYTLDRIDYPPEQQLFPAYHYVAVIPVDTAPTQDEVITVTADDIVPAATTIPPAFEISETPPSPANLPVTIGWSPVAPIPMEWWVTTPCTTDSAFQRTQVPRGDDAALDDVGMLSVEPVHAIDGSTECELTVWVDRYLTDGTAVGVQRRSVTFTANVY